MFLKHYLFDSKSLEFAHKLNAPSDSAGSACEQHDVAVCLRGSWKRYALVTATLQEEGLSSRKFSVAPERQSMREIVHIQCGQCGNQVSRFFFFFNRTSKKAVWWWSLSLKNKVCFEMKGASAGMNCRLRWVYNGRKQTLMQRLGLFARRN